MRKNDPLIYTIAKASKRCGISSHTLRYYDKEGLLPFVERSAAGTRQFKEIDFEWLSLITCLKETGMEIKQIKIFIDWCLEGDETIEKRLNVFVAQKEKVTSQIALLKKHLEKLEFKIGYYEKSLGNKTHRPPKLTIRSSKEKRERKGIEG